MRYKHNKVSVYMHFVWTTEDRLPLIMPDIERDLYRCVQEICLTHHCEVLAIGGMPDHVHLLLKMSPTVSMATLMKEVKGGSSRFVSERLKPGEWFRWRAHYGVFSVTPKDRERIQHYVQNQLAHHADHDLIESAEQSEIETDG